MPLRALLDNKDYWWHQLSEGDRSKPFICPLCKQPFVVVLPKEDIIRHFRHKSGREHWEPETPEHLNAKKSVYDLAIRFGFKAELEVSMGPYIADVVLVGANIKIAVECQCTDIPLRKVEEKTNFLFERGFCPLWIFGGEYWQHAQEKQLRSKRFSEYEIQRIKRVEAFVLKHFGRLIYFDGNEFWFGFFQYRYASKVLGWYKLRPATFSEVIYNVQRWIEKSQKWIEKYVEEMKSDL